MRRPLMVMALIAAVTAMVASVAMAVGTIGAQFSGPTMMRGDGQSGGSGVMGGHGQRSGSGMMGGESMMGATGGMGKMAWLPGDGDVASCIPAARTEPGPAMMWNTRVGMHAGSQGANTSAVTIGLGTFIAMEDS